MRPVVGLRQVYGRAENREAIEDRILSELLIGLKDELFPVKHGNVPVEDGRRISSRSV
jgi:hypothetical protein